MLCPAEHVGGWVEAGLFSCNCGDGGGLGHGGCGSCTIDVVHQLSGGVGGRGSSSILVPCCWSGCVEASRANSRLLAKYPSADGASGRLRMEGQQVVLTACRCCSEHSSFVWQQSCCVRTLCVHIHTVLDTVSGAYGVCMQSRHCKHTLLCSLSTPGTLSCAVSVCRLK